MNIAVSDFGKDEPTEFWSYSPVIYKTDAWPFKTCLHYIVRQNFPWIVQMKFKNFNPTKFTQKGLKLFLIKKLFLTLALEIHLNKESAHKTMAWS